MYNSRFKLEYLKQITQIVTSRDERKLKLLTALPLQHIEIGSNETSLIVL